MIINNHFYRFKSIFGYRLRALPSTHQLANPDEDPNEGYSVNFKLVLTNATDQPLVLQQVQVVGGWVTKTVTYLEPDAEETVEGRKAAGAATGCVGSAVWKIGDTGKTLAVMYSVPYDQDLYSNWLGVGIFDLKEAKADCGHHQCDPEDNYNLMYYQDEEGFARKDFYGDLDPVTHEGDGFSIEGSMGNSHTPTIQISIGMA